jgi:benzodiazapine receptor
MTTNTMQSTLPTEARPAAATGGDYLRQFAVIVITLVTISVNGLANALPLNGIQTGDISDKYATLFTPAGYVFAIWGVIYLGLLAYMVYQALPSQRTNPRLRAIGWWYVIGNLANTIWIFAWHWEQFLISLGLIVVLLVSLVMAYLRLAPARQVSGLVSPGERWTTHLPFSVYLGWVSVATVANAAVYLVSIGFDGGFLSPAVWTVVLLLVATGLGLFFLRGWRDIAYVGVLVWAFIGIAVNQSEVALVAWSAAGLAGLLAALSIAALFMRKNPNNATQGR